MSLIKEIIHRNSLSVNVNSQEDWSIQVFLLTQLDQLVLLTQVDQVVLLTQVDQVVLLTQVDQVDQVVI